MENRKTIGEKVLQQVSNLGWWLYVKIAWKANSGVQKKLDADTRDNLGYYLMSDNTKFKR